MTRVPLAARRPLPRGVAALTVVMVLFFVMALVAAYTNRNLVFEQRISANSYRATRALEAADAGVEWTLAMLNTGRTTANCTQAAAGFGDFRSRYLVPSADETNGEGAFDLPWGQVPANRVYPACIIVGGALSCICPAQGLAAPAAIVVPVDVPVSAFRITFRLFNDDTVRGGAMQFVSRGCANPGDPDTGCLAQTDDQPAVDGSTSVITTVGLVRALPMAPVATLTAGTTVTATAAGQLQLGVANGAPALAVQAGGIVDVSPDSRVRGPAGSGPDLPMPFGIAKNPPAPQPKLVVESASDDTGVAWSAGLLSAQGLVEQRWFRSIFVLDRASYQRQPATVRLPCAAGCTGATIANALLLNPRSPIWADGDVNLDADGPLGSVLDPMMLIVNGTLTVSGDVRVFGFVHANQITWDAPNTAQWSGAVVSESSFTANSVATLLYDKRVLDEIRLRYGSFVRAPGGWNLF